MFPCFREKPAFPTRDAPIDKRNLKTKKTSRKLSGFPLQT